MKWMHREQSMKRGDMRQTGIDRASLPRLCYIVIIIPDSALLKCSQVYCSIDKDNSRDDITCMTASAEDQAVTSSVVQEGKPLVDDSPCSFSPQRHSSSPTLIFIGADEVCLPWVWPPLSNSIALA